VYQGIKKQKVRKKPPKEKDRVDNEKDWETVMQVR
jgi:hypothetical protein